MFDFSANSGLIRSQIIRLFDSSAPQTIFRLLHGANSDFLEKFKKQFSREKIVIEKNKREYVKQNKSIARGIMEWCDRGMSEQAGGSGKKS